MSKTLIKLLRHDPSNPREDDGAVLFDDIIEEFNAKFDGTCLDNFHGKGRRTKEKNPTLLESQLFQIVPEFQSDPALQDNLLSQDDCIEYINHIRNVS